MSQVRSAQRIHITTFYDSIFVGNGYITDTFMGGYSGDNGPALDAGLFAPHGMIVDNQGDLYFADTGNHVIRVVRSTNQTIETVAGKCITL